jgi:hypothetical protein
LIRASTSVIVAMAAIRMKTFVDDATRVERWFAERTHPVTWARDAPDA